MCAARRIALIVILAAAQIALFRPFPGIAFTATAALPGPGRTGRRRQGTFYPSKDRALFSGCRTWVLRATGSLKTFCATSATRCRMTPPYCWSAGDSRYDSTCCTAILTELNVCLII
jgi:hypothetical protein